MAAAAAAAAQRTIVRNVVNEGEKKKRQQDLPEHLSLLTPLLPIAVYQARLTKPTLRNWRLRDSEDAAIQYCCNPTTAPNAPP